MRRIGTVPKIFEKYNLSRYGTSWDAEYKSIYASGRNGLSGGNHTTNTGRSSRWVSNQGTIGTVAGIEYDEDFVAMSSGGSIGISTSYALLQMSSTVRDYILTYLGDGTEVHRSTTFGSFGGGAPNSTTLSTRDTGNYLYHAFYGAGTVYSGSTDGTLLWNDCVFTPGGSYRYNGRSVGGDGLGAGSGSGLNHNVRDYDVYIASRSTNSISVFTQRYVERQTGTPTLSRPYNGGVEVVYSNLLGFFSTENYTRIDGPRSGVDVTPGGRYIFDQPNQMLYYYDVASDKTESVPVDPLPPTGYPETSEYYIFYGDTAFGFIGIRVFDWNTLETISTDWSVYRGTRKVKAFSSAVGRNSWWLTFGKSYLNVEDMRMYDSEADEDFDLSGVLPAIAENRSYYESSGIYGEMGLYYPEYYIFDEDGNHMVQYRYAYIISKKAVFRFDREGTSTGASNASNDSVLIAQPNSRNAQAFMTIHGQIVFVINEDRFEAYDRQTFMRLDNLPGFRTTIIRKIWERPEPVLP